MAVKAAGIHTVGRRKSAVARVVLKTGSGEILVNGQKYDAYFGRQILQMVLVQPLKAIDGLKKYDVAVNVTGGGKSGQAGAVLLGIARALIKSDDKLRPVLKKGGFLTRDAREVERKKYGRHKARKRPQFSKR